MTPNPEAVRALLVASNFFAYAHATKPCAPACEPLATPQTEPQPAKDGANA